MTDSTPTTAATVAIPRWAAELAAKPFPRICSVCLGLSPSSDGHDKNPPCIGAAREAIQEATTAARRTSVNEGGTVLSLDLQDEVDERLSGVIRHLARSGMDHDTFDNVYAPLLGLRDRLVPGKYS